MRCGTRRGAGPLPVGREPLLPALLFRADRARWLPRARSVRHRLCDRSFPVHPEGGGRCGRRQAPPSAIPCRSSMAGPSHDGWAGYPPSGSGWRCGDQALLALYRDTLTAWGRGAELGAVGPVVGPRRCPVGKRDALPDNGPPPRPYTDPDKDMDGGLWMAWLSLVVAIALIWWLMKLGRGALFEIRLAPGKVVVKRGLGVAALPGSGEADPAPGSGAWPHPGAARRQRRQARLLPLHPGARGTAPAQRLPLRGLSHDPDTGRAQAPLSHRDAPHVQTPGPSARRLLFLPAIDEALAAISAALAGAIASTRKSMKARVWG